MSTTRNLAKSIFLNALDIPSQEMRKEYLDSECGSNASLRSEVEELLSHQESLGDFLCEPDNEVQSTVVYDSTSCERTGTQVGPYKLLEQIGEGGFGVVFLAEQKEPIRREVALKVVKAGMDTKEVVARFEAERQALAMMEHPNIAKVLDGGSTESGRPYFVMELVPGIPITEYCDQCRLTTHERLKLYLAVSQAVQHAHQKGVIHRDLKPSNVLVAMQDGVPTPKIIDFGVAKAINQRLTENTLRTRFAQIVGTPLYMSPEQAELSPLGVDTRSDIYSLGVLLYELLTGTTPFDKDRLHSASFDELRYIIREEEPPRPSTRLSTLAGDLAQTVADRHRTETRQLTQTVRGDLDWIVMKAMEKDRTRRYATANELGRDVERYLNDEPVEACPPSAAYRAHKFVRRNKATIVTLAAIAASLVIGTGAAMWQAFRATAERNRAVAAEGVAAAEAARSEQVAHFLKDMLAAAGPSIARGRDATLLREVLQATADRIERDLGDQPEVQGDLWQTLGATYQDIGDHREAARAFGKAVECYRLSPGDPNAKLAVSLTRLGYSQSFFQEVDKGNTSAQAGVDMARLVGDKPALAECLIYRSGSFKLWGMGTSEAIPYLEEALELYRELGNRPLDEAECLRRLAACKTDSDQGEALASEAHDLYLKHLGEGHPNTLSAQWVLAQKVLNRGAFSEAEPLLRDTLQKWEVIFDANHPMNQVVRRLLAVCLACQHKWEEAYDLIDNAPTEYHSVEGQYANFFQEVFAFLAADERWDDVEFVLDQVRDRAEALRDVHGSEHPQTRRYEGQLEDMLREYETKAQVKRGVSRDWTPE